MTQGNNSKAQISVLTITPDYSANPMSGIGTHVFELTAGLQRLGARVTILAPTLSVSTVSEESGARVHHISLRNSAAKTGGMDDVDGIEWASEYFAQYAKQLIDIGDLRPDVIHCHDWYSFPAAKRLGNRYGIPVISTVHLLNEPVTRWWGRIPPDHVIAIEKLLCCESDALIIVSRSMSEIVAETHNVPPERTHVVPNGLDTRPFLKPATADSVIAQWRNLLGIGAKKAVLFAGRIDPQKGISAMIESAVEVVAAKPDTRYLLAGDPGGFNSGGVGQIVRYLKEELSTQYSEDLWRRVKFVGKLTRHKLAELYHVADLVLIPSIYENSPYAALESMAAGRPIVATAVGGMVEMIQHGVTGLLVPVHKNKDGSRSVDVGKLIDAQLELLNDGENAERMAKEAQQRVIKEFNWERMVNSTLQVYRRVIRGPAEP